MQRIKPERDIILQELKNIGVDPYALSMADKGLCHVIKLKKLKPGAANILKQESISAGMDTAVARGTVNCSVEYTDALLMGTEKSFKRLCERLKKQPFGLRDIAERLSAFLNIESAGLRLKGREFDLQKPLLMGILNVTPDSFSDGGKFFDESGFAKRLEEFVEKGVEIADIGGESTRPGAKFVSVEEEIRRVVPAVKKAVELGLCVSVDTNKGAVALASLDAGAHMINDISGLELDEKIAEYCAEYDAGICLMHMKGTPENMQKDPFYENLVEDVKDYLENSVEKALNYGIDKRSIIIDPGFGFGKTLEHNYILLHRLSEFKSMGYPVLAGISRKSMIGGVVDKSAEGRLAGTLTAEAIAVYNGADIIRAHDIDETADMIKIMDYLMKAGINA